jgi:hypothetical protein
MKPPTARRRLALECVTTPGAMSGFRPRPMPPMLLACPTTDGALPRYRKPLWRPFKSGAS